MSEHFMSQAAAGHSPDRSGSGRDISVDAMPSLRLLVPINAKDDSRWGIRYALQRQFAGVHVEVVLLNVGEPITQWEVLRFRTQQEIGVFQSERAQAFIDDASTPLRMQDIAVRGVFRQGDVAFSIIDIAEEHACDEIVMPHKACTLSSLFARDVVADVRRRQRGVPIIAVDAEGRPV